MHQERRCTLCQNQYIAKGRRSLFCIYCRKIKRKEWSKKSSQKHKVKIRIKRHLYDRSEKARLRYKRFRNTDKYREYARKRYFSIPEAIRKARYYVHNAVRDDKLVRLKNCQKCKREDWGIKRSMIEAHHYKGYSPEYWLVVQWLCTDCHKEVG